MSAALSSRPSPAAAGSIRVVVVDDSVVVRGLLSRWIGAAAGFEVVGTADSGLTALALVREARPDIVLLDLDMPGMGGLEALPLLLKDRPDLSVVVVSTLTQRNAEISIRCLRLGAIDYLPKPTAARELTLAFSFRDELLAKLDGIAARHRPAPVAPAAPPRLAPVARPHPAIHPRAIVIGASTGGPRALLEMLRGLGEASRRLPVLIVQHMPAIFTTVFARQIATDTGLVCREARSGEPVRGGTVLVAPGGRHLGLAMVGGVPVARIDDGPAVHHCRPSADILLRDAAAIYGGATLAVILTGMGSDGLEGARAIVQAGGAVLVQDEATSVVWGMPGSVARAGLAQAVLPLDRIAAEVESLAGHPAEAAHWAPP